MSGSVPPGVSAFLAAARALYPLVAVAWLLLLVRLKRPWWLLLGVIGANAWLWYVTTAPLGRLYALGVSQDRWNNIAMCQVVATGHSPLETWQVGQAQWGPHLRPYVMLWTVLVAALSGFSPGRLLWVYAVLPGLMSSAFAIAVFLGMRRRVPEGPWAAALMAGSATLLASSPLEFLAPFGVPWAKMFLLKPNHALGLVLVPIVIATFARIKSWRGRLAAGLLLHLLGWAFALHLAFFAVGLVAYVVLTAAVRKEARRGAALDVSVALGLNLLVVSPYLLRLLPRQAAGGVQFGSMLGAGEALLQATAGHGLVFLLGTWGAGVALRRGDRLGRLLAGQLVGALLVWVGYGLLTPAGAAGGSILAELLREADEAYYWLRFMTALLAGLGAWDLAERAAAWLRLRWSTAGLAAAACLLALPWTMPYWWDPVRMDPYFADSIRPLSPVLEGAAAYLRDHTDPDSVLAGDPYFAREAAALSGRRCLSTMGLPQPPDLAERGRVVRTLLGSPDPAASAEAVARYGVTHVAVTPLVLHSYELTLADLDARPGWRLLRVFGDPKGDFVALYRLSEG